MKINQWFSNNDQSKQSIAIGISAMTILCIMCSILLDQVALMIVPLGLLLALVSIYRFSWIYMLFFLTIPFSLEIYLPNGLGTDLPTEPLMLLLTGIGLVLGVFYFKKIPIEYLRNPITILILLHIFWIFFTAVTSQNQVVSFKFLLAKIWYVIPGYFLALFILRDRDWYTRWRVLFTIVLSISITYVMVRHAALGFSFDGINNAGSPIYRNHVNYAALLVVFLPHLWTLWAEARKQSKIIIVFVVSVCIFYILLATYFTYTRAAHACVFIMIGAYFIIRKAWVKPATYASLIVLFLGVSTLFVNNRYLDLAPNFERTVSHHSYDNLLEATYKMEDLSTMERVYRWVAGIQMVKERPLLGFGPGNFYNFYKQFTVSSFKTYVSHNPDKSGIHNYYLMTLVEQGILGCIIFLLLNIIALFYGERVYHRLRDPISRRIVMASMLSLIAINAMLLINDLIEADKVGPLFFFNLAVIVAMGMAENKRPVL